MKKKIKLSVIVPCYNVEAYLSKCIDSIINNKVKDMEIILINDGSKDKTLEIINEYNNKYSDIITVIDQKNQGLSMARNAGIKIARGEYISFVDSDDYIESGMYQEMLNKASEKNFDIVCCGVNVVYPNNTLKVGPGFENDCYDKESIKSIMNIWYTAAWNKIYKKELFKDLQFKKGIWYEDVEFLYRLIPNVNSIGKVDNCYYNYIQRSGSITYTYNDKLYDFINNFESIIKYYKDNKIFETYKNELEAAYVRYSFATFIKRLAKSKDKDKFAKGVSYAIEKVKENFPNYKSNPYLKKGMKNLYLKYFNPFIANIIFILEKNKMN